MSSGAKAGVTAKAFLGLAQLALVMGLAIFLPARTVHYVQGWTLLALFFAAALAITLYLAARDPALLARRTQAGPVAEARTIQKIIQGIASLAFLSTLVVSGLDLRAGWSRVPLPLVILGHAMVALGFFVVYLVFKENSFTSATIEVGAGQRVVDTGPYRHVRHPMYSGALVLIAGIPLALGSYVALSGVLVLAAVLVARIFDEERLLVADLPGYDAYRAKVRSRLLPHVW